MSRVARGRGDILEIREAAITLAVAKSAQLMRTRHGGFRVTENSYNRCGLHECDLRNSVEFFCYADHEVPMAIQSEILIVDQPTVAARAKAKSNVLS